MFLQHRGTSPASLLDHGGSCFNNQQTGSAAYGSYPSLDTARHESCPYVTESFLLAAPYPGSRLSMNWEKAELSVHGTTQLLAYLISRKSNSVQKV